MEKLLFTQRKTADSKSRVWKEILLALAVSLGVWLCLGRIFGLSWTPGQSFRGGIGGGLSALWNQAADVLGNSDYVLLGKTAGQSESVGLILTLFFLGTAVFAFFLIRSRRLWTLLFFTVPCVLNVIFQVRMGIAGTAVLAAALLAAAAYMKSGDGFWMKAILAGGLAVLCGLVIQLPGISDLAGRPEPVNAVQTAADSFFRKRWFGSDSLGNGDLMKRERKTDSGTALEITMSSPQSLYLRGFVGDMYTGEAWEALPASVYYNAQNLMYWLEENGFQALGQIGQAAALTGETEGENEIQVTVKNADRQYAYIPYETENVQAAGIRNWGNEFLTSPKGGRIRSYTVTAGDNAVKSWTTAAAKLFTTAQNEDGNPEAVREYLLNESYYNEYIYTNDTYLSKTDRELLYQKFGSAGDQSEGHIDYKKAIHDIRAYLKDNFIYTENLGAAGEKTGALEEFLTEKKGYDVQYATAATLLFRYYGIPARYVEGYLVTPEDVEGVQPGETIELSGERIHAWTEIYVDGIGFVPVEVSPAFEGVMEEADLSIGISNDSLVRSFERENSGGASDPAELISGGDEERQQELPYWIAVAVVLGILFLALLLLAARACWRRFAGSLKRRRLLARSLDIWRKKIIRYRRNSGRWGTGRRTAGKRRRRKTGCGCWSI